LRQNIDGKNFILSTRYIATKAFGKIKYLVTEPDYMDCPNPTEPEPLVVL